MNTDETGGAPFVPPVRHENHRPGADISDCPACMRQADRLGVDW